MTNLERLKTVLKLYPRSWKQALHAKKCNDGNSYQDILLWIDEQTPLLQNNIYSIATKIYWILNDIQSWDNELVLCKECHKPFIEKNVITIAKGYYQFCCNLCATKNKDTLKKQLNTRLSLYGQWESSETTYKRKQTNIKKYGYETWNQNPKLLAQYKEHNLENIGHEWPIQLEQNQQKLRKSIFDKYGVYNVFSLDEIKQKIIQFNIDNYGFPFYVQTEEYKKKRKQSFIDHYGVDHNMKSDIGKNEFKKSMQNKYGVDWSMQNHDIYIKSQKRYYYNNLYFDSAPEIAFYIYLIDHHIPFEYQPNCYFEYIINDKIMKYFPDFKVKDEYIEIKGLQFFKDRDPSKQMVCPYDHLKDDIYEAKHQCMIKNNVKIMTEHDYQVYLN